jgi:recombination protein RecA
MPATVRLAPPPGAAPELRDALDEVDRRYGPGVAFQPDHQPPPQVIPTGSRALDAALGVGGIPAGAHHRGLWP